VIEVDGESHVGKEDYDLQRQQFLERQGLIVLRFWDPEIFENLADVLAAIEYYYQKKWFDPPPPNPLPPRGGG